MFRQPLAVRLHAIAVDNVCPRCVRRLSLLSPPASKRPFSHQSRVKQSAATIATVRGHAIEKTYFWTNALRSQLQQQQQQSRIQGGGKATLGVTAGVAARTTASFSAVQRNGEEGVQEPAHRRRKRLKEEAAAANTTTTTSDTTTADIPLPPDASSTLSRTAAAAPPRSFRRNFSSFLALSKPRLAFLIVLTTTASYSIYPVPALLSTSATAAPSLSTLTLAFLTTGTFLTVASANTLNMLFEPAYDGKMSRTRNRPLVRGLISKRAALVFAVATGLVGSGILWYGVNPTTALLGAGNLAVYAFAYTALKRIHPVNTWVGAIVGAVPPLMGWTAAASQYSGVAASASDATSLWTESKELLFTEQAIGGWLLAALLFAWQFPHFFALSHAVRHEYAGAGYRMLTSFNIPMAARVSLRYSVLMFPICVGLTYYNVTDPAFVAASTVINSWMLREAWRFWRLNGEKGSARALFWASVWQLPIVLVMAMMLKKGLWARIMDGVFGVEEDDWEDDVLE